MPPRCRAATMLSHICRYSLIHSPLFMKSLLFFCRLSVAVYIFASTRFIGCSYDIYSWLVFDVLSAHVDIADYGHFDEDIFQMVLMEPGRRCRAYSLTASHDNYIHYYMFLVISSLPVAGFLQRHWLVFKKLLCKVSPTHYHLSAYHWCRFAAAACHGQYYS